MRNKFLIFSLTAAVLAILIIFVPQSWLRRIYNRTAGRFARHTVESRLAQIREPVLKRLGSHLENGTVPSELAILVFKREMTLELWGRTNPAKGWYLIRMYSVIAASGEAGPKLRKGDRQVPEGFYGVEFLHPNSDFYLALKVAYPSADDIADAKSDNRDTANLGDSIMIHGRGGSVGCVALDNDDIEEIFTLAALTGKEKVSILIFPRDFLGKSAPDNMKPAWLGERYRKLYEARNKSFHWTDSK